jgi:tetratricopeptide (TPR) repeat protein
MWSRRSTSLQLGMGHPAAALVLLLVAACSSAPKRVSVPEPAAQAPGAAASASPATGATAPGTAVQGAAGQVAAAQGAAAPPPPPAQAVAEFDLAVSVLRKGGTTEAQRRFELLAIEYPQFAGAEINLGILYRKAGQLDLSEQALREAVHRNAASAEAWNELGVTLRLRGRFHDAEDAYRKAIAADASFAPAYRNLGVVLDLYLGDAPGALAAFERYKELSGEQKPVSGWIAELRRRAGKSAAPSAGAAPPTGADQAHSRELGGAPTKQSRAPVGAAATAPADAGA